MENRIYGYARVSDKDQNEARQTEELLAFGIDRRNIKIDKASGKDFNRKAYLSLVGTEQTEPALRQGDLLVILSIDRLGRNYTEIIEQWKFITQELKADIKVLDMPLLDTRQQGDSLDNRFIADLVLQILSYVAQKERENIKKRQAQGIAVAKAQGKHLGRPQAEYPELWQDVYATWKAKQITAVAAFQRLGLTKNTFYNLVKRYENE
jgi:DNA invertase Pin-like site-specific DNA recombinase